MARINTSRKSGYVYRSGGRRRESAWVAISETSNTLASANAAVLSHSANAALLAARPFTIVRTHLTYFVKSDQTGALEAYESALAMAVVSDQAVAIGITAVPTPMTDRESDLFFLFQDLADQFMFISGVGVQAGNVGRMIQVDSKAMRKVEEGQDLIVVEENSSLQASGTTQVVLGRLLIKLH